MINRAVAKLQVINWPAHGTLGESIAPAYSPNERANNLRSSDAFRTIRPTTLLPLIDENASCSFTRQSSPDATQRWEQRRESREIRSFSGQSSNAHRPAKVCERTLVDTFREHITRVIWNILKFHKRAPVPSGTRRNLKQMRKRRNYAGYLKFFRWLARGGIRLMKRMMK